MPISPFRVAIVGAGPAGFYAADKLLKTIEGAEVEVFEKLATPWGLVRAGVAPDHPNIKAVSRVYEKTAKLPGFRFHGHTEVGVDITHDELLAHHHAVIYTSGASADRRVGIPGEDLPGSFPATDFVAWYNGHPSGSESFFDLGATRAVVIGNGNVALDVARMLMLGRDELAVTDIADHALDALAQSAIEEVVVLGRRGPAQAAYTTPELRELGELALADVIVDPEEVRLDPASAAWLESDAADGTSRRNVEVVQEYATRTPSGKPRRVVLRFLASPVEIVGENRVEAVRIVRNELVEEDGVQRARATDETETIEAGLVLRSVGYLGVPLPDVPFDERTGTILNEGGRVIDPEAREPISGVYTAGWIKRGPSGVIGTNKKCSNETVALIVEDREAGLLDREVHSAEHLEALLQERHPDRVDYAGWQRIDEHERGAGEPHGRPRVKLTRTEQLLERAHGRAG